MLTIQGGTNVTGKLTATGGGENVNCNGTNITISVGTVTAISNIAGAGIGGAGFGEGSDIKITGGSVYAKGGTFTDDATVTTYFGADIGDGIGIYTGTVTLFNGTPVITGYLRSEMPILRCLSK